METSTSLLFLAKAEARGLDYLLKFEPIKIVWKPIWLYLEKVVTPGLVNWMYKTY
jgi:hypothetical protein